jgi:hypothetical protein
MDFMSPLSRRDADLPSLSFAQIVVRWAKPAFAGQRILHLAGTHQKEVMALLCSFPPSVSFDDGRPPKSWPPTFFL